MVWLDLVEDRDSRKFSTETHFTHQNEIKTGEEMSGERNTTGVFALLIVNGKSIEKHLVPAGNVLTPDCPA